ncbi:MAG: DNA-binding transcriptional regulator [Bacteroidales bacterium]|nr:DNA-binding transcriptional regulator [Bacteroidales bacterium]MBR2746850.1 DNA-binding transcriptional regulator [Bacteroidales bacterium]MBR4686915.1 DNA-binding transcriptional regulator [Bacteroidales bacterium]
MIRLLIISDFTESFSHKLLAGIVDYSRRKEQWIVRRMPPSYKAQIGIQGLLRLSKEWDVDAILGQFEPTDDLSTLTDNGIVVVAQDFKQRFASVPNVTGDYIGTGKMAARFFIDRGFKNFGFFGFNDVCWSDERCEGFRREIEAAGFGSSFYAYRMQEIDMVWYYQRNRLREWLQSIPKPIAIMACDDNQGENLIEACHSIGIKIPSEVSVMGVDNDETLCSLGSTTLSSIQVDIEEGGRQTAALLERLVTDPSAPAKDVVLQPMKIVNRMSTAAFATQDQQILRAILFIHRNVRKKISVADVTAEAALSRRLLERRFKDVTGKTLYEYITELKLKDFADQLVETDEQVMTIALSMGENDTKSISRRFKQLYGCTPLQWRESQRKKPNTL